MQGFEQAWGEGALAFILKAIACQGGSVSTAGAPSVMRFRRITCSFNKHLPSPCVLLESTVGQSWVKAMGPWPGRTELA